MNYNIKAIETKYGGILFRSRLEAKWAAMFDLLGWEWSYEPVDFDQWIPDFSIHGNKTVYVEVKPVEVFPDEVAERLEASGCTDEMLILGSRGPVWEQSYKVPVLGWLAEANDRGHTWDEAVMGRWGSSPGITVGFCSASGAFVDRITGGYDGGCFGNGQLTMGEITSLWRESCNRTRWNPRETNK